MLPDDLRELIKMKFDQKMSYKEISKKRSERKQRRLQTAQRNQGFGSGNESGRVCIMNEENAKSPDEGL